MKHQVTFNDNKTYQCASDEDLITAAKQQSVTMASGCCGGECGACVAKLVAGKVEYQSGYQANILTKNQQAEGMIVCCMAQPKTDVVLTQAQPARTLASAQTIEMQLQEREQLTNDVLKLVLTPANQQELSFIPGQFVEIELSEKEKRCYSIANCAHFSEKSKHSNTIELHVKQYQGGLFSDITCSNLSVGDCLKVTVALGQFYWRKELDKPIILAATGTGFAPMQGILQEIFSERPEQELHLYWGGRTDQDLYQHNLLIEWQQQFQSFHYTPVLSQPGDNWHGQVGHVQQAIVEKHPELSNYSIYLAGSSAMVKKCQQVFTAFGMNAEQLFCDSFTPAKTVKVKTNLFSKISSLFSKAS